MDGLVWRAFGDGERATATGAIRNERSAAGRSFGITFAISKFRHVSLDMRRMLMVCVVREAWL